MRQSIFELSIERKLKILMAARLILAIAFLSGAVLTSFPRLLFYYFIGSICLFTIIYISALRTGRAILFQSYFQIVFDGIFLTGLIHWTGGIDSPFIFLYILPIVSAAIIISPRASIIVTIILSAFYTACVKLESYEVLTPFNPASYSDPGMFTYLLFLHVSTMVIISLLSSYLSESLRRKGIELRELRSFTDEILNNIPSGVIAFDSMNRITYINSFAKSFLEISGGAVKGETISSIWPNKNEKIGFPYLREKSVIEGETYLELGQGRKVPVRFVASRLYHEDNKVKGGVVIFHDISKERLSAIGEMAAELAHEIRNPLAAMSGSLEVLREEISLSGENEKIIDLILKESQCLNIIVNDFLNFSRSKELHITDYPLRKVIDEALELVRNHPNFSDKIEIVFNSNINPNVKIDPDEMRQAFLNLSLNAIEAMPNGGNLNIKIEEDNKKKTVNIYFSDEGPGILSRDKARLFEPFYTTKERGVGLGLAISSRIVKEHGGDISVENNPEGGATFIIKLPSHE